MDLKKLCSEITAGAPDGIENGGDWYTARDPEVRDAVSAFLGVKSDLLIGPFGFRRDELRISLILSERRRLRHSRVAWPGHRSSRWDWVHAAQIRRLSR